MSLFTTKTDVTEITARKTDVFYNDVVRGLQSTPKYLESKYFYDAIGDQLFMELMKCPEYYLTNCELEIFSKKTENLAAAIVRDNIPFDLIELGAGDAMKSTYLLDYLLKQDVDFHYMPIDISSNVITNLQNRLPGILPNLPITGLNGEYFDMLKKATSISTRPKVVLFLGSNIGNMPINGAIDFCKELRGHLKTKDKVLIGMDLKKNPKTILAAYNDQGGITKRFNLNLLDRINHELQADFKRSQFDHYATYDPESGACKSYLISTTEQEVNINGKEKVYFRRDEAIYMEISQKFTLNQSKEMAKTTGFNAVNHFFDSKEWFIDVIWEVA